MSDPRSRLVLAPMAGGPTTPALVAAAAAGGALGFLAAGYLAPDALARDVAAVREAGVDAFGVNLFVPSPDHPDTVRAARGYRDRLAPLAELAGVELGQPRWDDDAYDAKLALLLDERPAVVSFAFGWPAARDVARLRSVGAQVWVTVNDPGQVAWALELGADAVVAQGDEAGGHRGGPVDAAECLPTEDLARAVRPLLGGGATRLVAAGGATHPEDVARLLAAGADAVQCGTAFLRADEAGTSAVHRDALAHREGTVVTRTFTGRAARALRTAWTDLHTHAAPAAYPHVHFVTAPLRAYGRETGQPDLVNLWAGTGHSSARSAPAREVAAALLAAG